MTDQPELPPVVDAGSRIKQRTLGEEVFDRILELIYSGELPPGSAINEAVLAQRFGVSRGPVREAVRHLQGIQLVAREPYMKARVVRLSVAEVEELFQIREALEGYAARLAAQVMTPAEIASLSVDLERARQSALQGGDGSKAGFDFHERIMLASRNRRIYDTLYGDLQPLMRIYRRQSGAVPAREEAAYLEHWQVLRAIKSGDGELAESLTRSHIARASQHVIQRLAEAGAGAPARRA